MKVNPFKTTLYSSVLLAGLAATSVAAADEAKDVATTTDMQPYQIRLQNQVLILLKQQEMQQLSLQYLEQKKKLLLKQILL